MAKIVWTREAASWVEAIHKYVAADSPAAARRLIAGIHEKIRILKTHPRLGQRVEKVFGREVRELLYGNYRIIYLVKSESRIEILGVFHAAMDISRFLK